MMNIILNCLYKHPEFGTVRVIDIRDDDEIRLEDKCLIIKSEDTEISQKCLREELSEVGRPFQRAFTPPFHFDPVIDWVYDLKNRFCFQFMIDLKDEQRERAMETINTGRPQKDNVYTFIRREGVVRVNGHDLILIRGWGYLTGGGALNLDGDVAGEIQDDLGNYLAEQLNKKSEK